VAFKDKESLKTKSNVHWVVEEELQTANVREGIPNLAKVTKGH
jgi:hypothetical protein